MLKAFKLHYTPAVAVELNEKQRAEIVTQVVTMAEKYERGGDETFIFALDWNGKACCVCVDIGKKRVHIMTKAQAEEAGVPSPWAS